MSNSTTIIKFCIVLVERLIGTVSNIFCTEANNFKRPDRLGCFYPCYTSKFNHPLPGKQSGVVLVVGLIMLLLLTLIGVTGSQTTGLEEKMTGNKKNYNIAFQAAESALRAGEAATATIVAANYYTGSTQPYDWANAKVSPYHGGTLVGVQVANAPKYIIEMIGTTNTVTSSGGSLEAGTAASASGTANWYRITAQGKGTDANAVVTLQSIYKR